MKRKYESPEIEIKTFTLTSDLLYPSNETDTDTGEENGDGNGWEVTRGGLEGNPINGPGFGW